MKVHLVLPHVRPLSETFPANITNVWFLSRVNAPMTDESVRPFKSSPANVARETSLPRVYHPVLIVNLPGPETLITILTLVRFLAGVSPPVVVAVRLDPEPFSAEIARMRRLACVKQSVRVHC